MVILIMYLTLKSLALLFAFIYVILLFHWVYFTSFFDHSIEQNMLLLIKKQPQRDLLQNSCSKSELNQLKYACESVPFLLKLQVIELLHFTKIELSHWYFSEILIIQLV